MMPDMDGFEDRELQLQPLIIELKTLKMD